MTKDVESTPGYMVYGWFVPPVHQSFKDYLVLIRVPKKFGGRKKVY